MTLVARTRLRQVDLDQAVGTRVPGHFCCSRGRDHGAPGEVVGPGGLLEQSAPVPAPFVPTRLPAMTLRFDATRSTPSPALRLMRFQSPAAVPPIRLSLPSVLSACWQKPLPLRLSLRDPMPSMRLPNATVPVASVPTVLPCTVSP